MEPDTSGGRTDNGDRGGNSGVGCLTWVLGAVVVGVLLSFFSVVYSVDFTGYGIIDFGPSGFTAGFPIPFVEFYDGDAGADANDPPSTIFGMYALGGSVSEVYSVYAAINAVPWVIFALMVAAFARWVSRLQP